jgi:hypothetical protein
MLAKGVDRDVPHLGLALLVCAALALWIDLSGYHRDHYADSLIPVLTSLQRWTPFFWGCNRIGMLVPLLALPFAHPLVNLLVQCWLVLFAALAVFVLLPRYLLRDGSWPWASAVGALGFLGLPPGCVRFYFTFGQPHYVVALALGLGGALLVEQAIARGRKGWLAAAQLLLLLACWVNSATPLFLGGLVLLRGGLLRRPDAPAATLPGLRRWVDAEAEQTLLLLLSAALAGWLVQCCVPTPVDTVTQGLLPIRRWPAAWYGLALHAVRATGVAFFAVPALAAGGLLLVPAVRRRAGLACRAAVVLLGAAGMLGMVMGTLKWVMANQLDCRYVLPAILYGAVALAVLATAPLAAVVGSSWRRIVAVGAVPVLFLTAAWGYGLPSLARVRADVAGWQALVPGGPHAVGPLAREVVAARCSHMAGCYWTVWPTVFLVNLELFECGEERRVWGVSERSAATQELWGRLPADAVRLGVRATPAGMEPEAAGYLEAYFPRLEVSEKRLGLWVLREESPPRSHAPRGNAARPLCGPFTPEQDGPQSVQTCVPTRSVGTRGSVGLAGAPSSSPP